jgi:TolB-like protein
VQLPAHVSAQQAVQAPQQQTVQVAVFPLTGLVIGNAAQQRELAEAFRSMIISELASAAIRTIERQSIDRMLESQNISLAGAISDEQAIRVGQLLGAQYAVAGSISMAGNDARLDLRMIDIETGEHVHTFKDQAAARRVLTLADRVAAEFAGRAQLKPRPVPLRIPAAASLAYSQGLDYERRGRRQEAARMYRRALELFPQHPHARAALQRVN